MKTENETTVFTGKTLERHNNKIKTKVLNEVIEMVYEEIRSAQQGMNIYLPLNHLLTKFQSMLPKEEPDRQIKEPIIRCTNCNQEVKPEPTQEIKVGDEAIDTRFDELGDVLHIIGDEAWFKRKDRTTGTVVPLFKLQKVQPTKTQEEMDREWKRESLIAHPMNDDSLDDLLQKAINYGRNTKQN